MNVKCWCRHCQNELEPTHIGVCPYCGKTGKDCKAVASVAIGISASTSVTKTRTHIEYHNKRIRAVILIIIVDFAILLITTGIGFLAGKLI